jgi:hypothetical protein
MGISRFGISTIALGARVDPEDSRTLAAAQ